MPWPPEQDCPAAESLTELLSRLQIDCNLYGMGHVKLSQVAFRGTPPENGLLERKGWNPRPTIVQEQIVGECSIDSRLAMLPWQHVCNRI